MLRPPVSIKKRLFFLFLCPFIFQFSQGQVNLEGEVLNQEGQIIPYATLSLQEVKKQEPILQQSDSLGAFSFTSIKKGRYSLEIYALGFGKKEIALDLFSDTTLQLHLNPLTEDLEGVTVVGNKPIIEHKADRLLFHVPQSMAGSGTNGLDILKLAPGVKVKEGVVSLSGRGELGVMINGRILHLSEKALVNYLKSFSSSGISTLEIITHPGASYEAEGQAGLINIITKKTQQSGLSGTVEGALKRFFYKNQPDYKGIKNYGDVDGAANLFFNSGKWSLYSNISNTAGRELWGYGIGVHYPDKFWNMGDTGEYRIETFNLLTGADYRLSNQTTIGLEYNYAYHLEDGADYVNIPILNNQNEVDSSIRTVASYFPISKSNGFNFHLLQGLHREGAQLTLNADYYNYYRTDWSDLTTQSFDQGLNLKPGSFEELSDTGKQNIKITTLKVDLEWPTTFAHFSAGSKLSFIDNYSNIFYYEKENTDLTYLPDISNEFKYIENTQAAYFNAAKTVDRWKMNVGIRGEVTQTKAVSYFEDTQVKEHDVKLFPSISIEHQTDQENSYTLAYNRRIHRPSFWNMNPYKTFMSAYTYVEGNPYLKPEYVSNFQFTHQYKQLLTSTIYVNLLDNGFAQVIRTQDTGPYLHITSMLNFYKSRRYGISEATSFSLFNWLETQATATGYYARTSSSVDYINGIHYFGIYGELNNTFHLNSSKTLDGYLGIWYQSPDVENFGKTNAYYNVDMGFQWSIPKKHLKFALNFSDLFKSSAYKIHTVVDGIHNTYTAFQLNSQIRLSVNWDFGKGESKKQQRSGNEAEINRL